MPKPKLKKSSKRLSCHKKYKIIRKVKEHNRKARKEEKAKGNKRKPKDPGIPNLFPFKEQLLKQIEERREKDKEDKEKRKAEKTKEKSRKRKLQDLQKDAEKRAKLFDKKQALENEEGREFNKGPLELSRRSYYKEFRKVVEAADVIIQVLDARDPLGCRCPQLEEIVMASGRNKKIVLLLNKVDLVPKDNVQKWLKYLRNQFPTVAFKASTQNQKQKLAQSKVPVNQASTDLLQSGACIGANVLMKLLGNYCRNQDIKTSITVGVVGFPNVGKSSVINSLKRSRACNVGSTPGVTKNMQEIQLDQHVKLLDCPGIVMATGSSDTQIILKNVVKVESLDDPAKPVEAILNRCSKEQVMQKYCVPDYSNTLDFLTAFALRMGKLKKGGIPDTLAAAKILLQDWNSGKITFYTHPPEAPKDEQGTATIAQYWGAGFDINAIEKAEKDELNGLADVLGSALILEAGKPTDMEIQEDDEAQPEDDGEMENDEESEEENEEEKEEDMEESDDEVKINNPILKQSVIALKASKKKKVTNENSGKNEKKKESVTEEDNPQTNALRKKAFKNKQKEKRKQDKKILSSEENKTIADNEGDAYDFNQAF